MASLEIHKRALLRDVQVREHPLWVRYHPQVDNLVRAMRRLDGPASLRAWHTTVLETVLDGESAIRDLQRQAAQVASLISGDASLEAKSARSGLLSAVKYERDAIAALLALLRTLADAVVWQLLDFDRAALTALGEGTATRHLASGDGLEQELATIERLWDESGTVAIHADLTTSVRHGDLLCLDQWSPRHWRIQECKAGRGAGDRRRKQLHRMQRLEHLLNTGTRPATDEEPELRIVECPVVLRAHHHATQELIDDARLRGYAETWLEDGVFAQVTDHRDVRAGAMFDTATPNERALAGRGIEEEAVVRYSTQYRRIRDRRRTFSSQAPLGLLPYAREDVTDLCMGRLDLMVTLDARALERRFKQRGIDAHVAVGAEAEHWFVLCAQGEHGIRIPAPAREQVLLEGLTIDALIDVGEWTLQTPSLTDQGRETAVRYDERAMWRPLDER